MFIYAIPYQPTVKLYWEDYNERIGVLVKCLALLCRSGLTNRSPNCKFTVATASNHQACLFSGFYPRYPPLYILVYFIYCFGTPNNRICSVSRNKLCIFISPTVARNSSCIYHFLVQNSLIAFVIGPICFFKKKSLSNNPCRFIRLVCGTSQAFAPTYRTNTFLTFYESNRG